MQHDQSPGSKQVKKILFINQESYGTNNFIPFRSHNLCTQGRFPYHPGVEALHSSPISVRQTSRSVVWIELQSRATPWGIADLAPEILLQMLATGVFSSKGSIIVSAWANMSTLLRLLLPWVTFWSPALWRHYRDTRLECVEALLSDLPKDEFRVT